MAPTEQNSSSSRQVIESFLFLSYLCTVYTVAMTTALIGTLGRNCPTHWANDIGRPTVRVIRSSTGSITASHRPFSWLLSLSSPNFHSQASSSKVVSLAACQVRTGSVLAWIDHTVLAQQTLSQGGKEGRPPSRESLSLINQWLLLERARRICALMRAHRHTHTHTHRLQARPLTVSQ